jgi:hypothetical protein
MATLVSSFLTGFLLGQSSIFQRQRYWTRHISDNVFQILLGNVVAIKFAVYVTFIDWDTNNVTGIFIPVRTVPACMSLLYTASTFFN